jgi:aldose 1-epimerase
MAVTQYVFDRHDGIPVPGYRLEEGGITAEVVAYGARLQGLSLPDRHGVMADVIVGAADIAGHIASQAYFGATCGRYGNRIGNGRFTLDAKQFEVSRNQDGKHLLHGGFAGLDTKIWQATPADEGAAVTFSTLLPDGDEGFPGALAVTATYRLRDRGLEISFTAEADRPTVLNLVNHAYWNLAGQGEGTIRDHHLQLDADRYTPTDTDGIPSGEIRNVVGTAFDFRAPKAIGRDLAEVPPSRHGKAGYDLNFCLNSPAGALRPVGRLFDPRSGRGFDLLADTPGVQLYTGGHMGPHMLGKAGRPYQQFGGLCLEVQSYPDSPNHGNFPSTRLDPGAPYERRMRFAFFTD